MKKIVMMLLLGSLVLNAGEYKSINWSNLEGKMEVYDDPFKKLTEEQIHQLSIYARFTQMKKMAPKRLNDSLIKNAKIAEEILKKEGVDIAYLLSQREHITKMRKKAAYTSNMELNNTSVSMSGFMLALQLKEGKTKEFLLVPTVGACIHTPPPPPNQIVYVTTKNPVVANARFEAVTISGKMLVKSEKNNLFLVDGKSDINSAYTMQADNVVQFLNK